MKTSNKDSDLPPLIKDVTGLILAGGKSSRFGSNKAFVEIDGIPLIERITHIIGCIFDQVILISNSPEEYSFLELPIHKDLIPDLGPIGGIYTGLSIINSDAGFFVACDMPLINEDLIRYIVSVRDDFDAVVPRVSDLMEPLHAVYSKKALPSFKSLIESGIFQTMRSYQTLNVRYVEENEIKGIDPDLRSFLNINRPNELSEIIKLHKRQFNRG